MPIIAATPRELGRATYSPGLISGTSTATHGAALSTPWGFSYTTGANGSVDIEISIPFVSKSEAGDTNIHVLNDGVCVLNDNVKTANATGHRVHGKTTVTGLAAGSHTVAVQMSVASGTGLILTGSPDLVGLLIVREVG